MKTRLLSLGVAALTMGLAITANAEPQGKRGHGAEGRHGNPQRLFEQFDSNHDGAIARAEAESVLASRFGKADSNRDGFLSPEEFAAQQRERRAEHLRARFVAEDTNKDGRLARTETRLPSRVFEAADRDHDGLLTPVEFEAATPAHGHREAPNERLKRLDQDRDGKVSRAELGAQIKKVFERFDTNHDGVIQRAEVEQRRQGRGRHAGHPARDAR